MMKSAGELIFKISIVGYSKVQVDKSDKKVTMYEISVSNPVHNWKIKHRYNDFCDLHDKLQLNYKSLPKLPQKTLFAINSEQKIEKRRLELEKYLSEVLLLDNIMFNIYAIDFLKVEQFSNEYVRVKPLVMFNYETVSSLTFTDINYVPGRTLNYALLSKGIDNPSLVSSPSKNEKLASQGVVHKSLLNGFKFDEKDPINLFQDKKVVKTFDVKAHCLQYFPEAAVVVVGFSQGILSIYKEEKKPKGEDEYQLINIQKLKVSGDRITRIGINTKRGLMYVILRNNKLKIIDMATWQVKSQCKLGGGPILNFTVNEDSDLALSTTEDGKLLVINIADEIPVIAKELKVTPTKCKLNCMDWHIDAGKVVCAAYETGEIYLIDIGFPFTHVSSWRKPAGV